MNIGKLDEEPNRGGSPLVVDRRGPINDIRETFFGNGRHDSPQLLFSYHEIWKSNNHAVNGVVSECMLNMYKYSLAALDESDNGNTICWIKPGDLNHISETIPP